MKRLFFAMEFAGAAVPVITEIQHGLQRCVRDERVRWVPEDRWHITTHFLGDATDQVVEELIDAMALLPQDPIQLTTWGVNVFPSTEKPRALVLRLADMTTAAFEAYHAQIPIILRAGWEIDTRPWKPHVTLGRIRPGRGHVRVNLEPVHVPQYEFSVTQITLFESHLGPKVRYVPLASIDLPRT